MSKKILVFSLCLIVLSGRAFAFWVWTPETRRWINPKYAVKETPQKQLEYALEIAGQENYKKAEAEMRKLLKHYPKAREAADAQFYIAECEEKRGDFARAFQSYQMVIKKYPFTQRTDEVVKRQYDMASRLLEGGQKNEKGLWKKITASNVNLEEIFKQVIKNSPYGEYAAPSQYKIGLFLKEDGFLQEARDAFEKAANDYPDSEWAKAAQYQIALADAERSAQAGYDQKITQSAISEFKDFVQEYPDAELSQEARQHIGELRNKEAENNFMIAEFYERQKKYKAARVYYSMIVDEYQDTVWAKKALEAIQQLGMKK